MLRPLIAKYDSNHQHKSLSKLKINQIITLQVTHWDILDYNLVFYYARGRYFGAY